MQYFSYLYGVLRGFLIIYLKSVFNKETKFCFNHIVCFLHVYLYVKILVKLYIVLLDGANLAIVIKVSINEFIKTL